MSLSRQQRRQKRTQGNKLIDCDINYGRPCIYLQLSLVNEPLGLHLHGQTLVPLLGIQKTEEEIELLFREHVIGNRIPPGPVEEVGVLAVVER